MIYIGCVADDFTGAGDAASFLKAAGLKTLYLNGDQLERAELPAEIQAVVIALKCRSIPAAEAVEQVARCGDWLLEKGAQHLYYKYCSTFDSTEKGNIGPVVDMLMEKLDVPFTVLCPALPVNGRTVKEGVLSVNGVPLAESPMKDHPITPMRDSYIPRLMQRQSHYASYALPAALLADAEGREAFLKAHEAEGRFTLAPDYRTDEDGKRIAEAFGSLRLLTGGSGLLGHLGRAYLPQAEAKAGELREDASDERGRLLLAGSCSAMTQKQVARYLAAGKEAVRIDPLAMLAGEQSFDELAGRLREAQGDILFYSTASPEQVRENQRHGAEQISAMLENTMGLLAEEAVQAGYRRIVVAGGETSGQVMKTLDFGAYEIFESVSPGVPRMVPIQRPELNLVLKSGNFGEEDFLLRALNRSGN